MVRRILILVLLMVGGCITQEDNQKRRPKIKGISIGAMYLDTTLGQAGRIKEVVPVGLINIEF